MCRQYIYLILLLTMCICLTAKRKAQGKTVYQFNISGEYIGCEDEGENVFNYTTLEVISESPTSTLMAGSFALTQPFSYGTQVHYKTYKLTDSGKELAWTMELPDFCELVEQENMPWSPVFDAMDLNPRRCPIPAGIYDMKNGVKMDMSFMQSHLSKDSVGEYEVAIEMTRIGGIPPKSKRLACFNCGYKIDEVRQDIDAEE